MPIERTYTLYHFDELDCPAKEKAIQKLWDINLHHDWHEFTIEGAKEAGMIMGIDVDEVCFEGFDGHNNGACFSGSYDYKNGAAKDIKQERPTCKELHRIARALQDAQRLNFYEVSVVITTRHYYHPASEFSVYRDNYNGQDIATGTEDAIEEALRDFAQWIYDSLEDEYSYLTSEEAIVESIIANEYTFSKDGALVL